MHINLDSLKAIEKNVDSRHGWDFSNMHDARDPVPWDYEKVARRYLRPTARVLDTGTGGGEVFLRLAPTYDRGVAIDIDRHMIDDALENLAATEHRNVAFAIMAAQALAFPANSFDIVLNRHASFDVNETVRVLRPGGLFITQQVGNRNTLHICNVFGVGPGGTYEYDPEFTVRRTAQQFAERGCHIIAQGEYDVDYRFLDLESFLFWLKAIPMPEDFTLERHWRSVQEIIEADWTKRGLLSNEHRELLIVRKPTQTSSPFQIN